MPSLYAYLFSDKANKLEGIIIDLSLLVDLGIIPRNSIKIISELK